MTCRLPTKSISRSGEGISYRNMMDLILCFFWCDLLQIFHAQQPGHQRGWKKSAGLTVPVCCEYTTVPEGW